ncbi:hypothetical protein KI387_037186, partial [Taxus chinensis]
FVEKILRVQPEVSCIFTLIRAKNLQSAQARLQNQVISSKLFRVLREIHRGNSYEEFMAQKVMPVVGDVALDGLGIEQSVKDQLCAKINIVVNAAATTSFYERCVHGFHHLAVESTMDGLLILFSITCRYDIAMKVNVLGSYVNVGNTGIVREDVLRMGESAAIVPSDIESECYLIRKTLKEFRLFSDVHWSEEEEAKYMKELGLE